MRYRLDRRVEHRDGGRVLLGGDPTKLLRLSGAGASAVLRWSEEGVERDGAGPGVVALIDRLVAAGMAHPEPAPATVSSLTVVVPVRDRAEALDRCLDALVASGISDIVVVDDGSRDPMSHQRVAAVHGAAFVARPRSDGPAAARASGWTHLAARSDPPRLMAFVDSDIEVTPECWNALLGHFSAPECGLAAPRVVHRSRGSIVDRYEVANSPLDLGSDPAPIVAGTRVAYVPAAVLVVRTAAFAAVGGFDESLDVGEDVDLVWRLADAGWRCRYEPAAIVSHAGRSALGPMLRRRFDYGRSAAQLDARHPGALPPVRGSRWSAAVVGLVAAGHPAVAFGVAGWTVREMARKLDPVARAVPLAARLVLTGHLGFARQVARATVRPWFPITLAVSLLSRRVRRRAVLVALVAPVLSWRDRRPPVPLPTWIALWLADDLAYTAGVWSGCLRLRTVGPLRPDVQPDMHRAKTQN